MEKEHSVPEECSTGSLPLTIMMCRWDHTSWTFEFRLVSLFKEYLMSSSIRVYRLITVLSSGDLVDKNVSQHPKELKILFFFLIFIYTIITVAITGNESIGSQTLNITRTNLSKNHTASNCHGQGHQRISWATQHQYRFM